MITLHSLFLFYNNYGLILRHRLHLPSYYGKIGVQALQKSAGNYLLSEICVFL